jgi:hypothetical protein
LNTSPRSTLHHTITPLDNKLRRDLSPRDQLQDQLELESIEEDKLSVFANKTSEDTEETSEISNPDKFQLGDQDGQSLKKSGNNRSLREEDSGLIESLDILEKISRDLRCLLKLNQHKRLSMSLTSNTGPIKSHGSQLLSPLTVLEEFAELQRLLDQEGDT